MNYYNWEWFDGAEDCNPPEPDKKWIGITNAHDDSEVCILVLRNPKKFEHLVPELEERAVQIISALEQQLHDQPAEGFTEALIDYCQDYYKDYDGYPVEFEYKDKVYPYEYYINYLPEDESGHFTEKYPREQGRD